MDALSEIYRSSPDWLKLVMVLQPTLWIWGPVFMIWRQKGVLDVAQGTSGVEEMLNECRRDSRPNDR